MSRLVTLINSGLLQIIHYYLVDDTVEIREVHSGNDGRDPFPVLVCRQRLPKDRNKVECKHSSTLLSEILLTSLLVFKTAHWYGTLSHSLNGLA